MNYLKVFPLFFLILLFPVIAHSADSLYVNFDNETVGAQSKVFSSFVGTWRIDKDDNNIIYAVDGRKWARGTMSGGIAEKAKLIYGERYAEFLDNLKAYKYFPLSIYQGLDNFNNGNISVSFKAISGRIDQAAGIAFNIKPNGDYLVIRANPLENNMVAFKMKKGRRSSIQWIRKIPTNTAKWYILKVVIKGNKVKGYLNDKQYINLNFKTKIDGRIGLWSKSDSYVIFDNFTVEQK